MPPTPSASERGDTPASRSPVSPNSSTPDHVAGAAHFTHALALQATLPPEGRNEGADAPAAERYCPLLSASALFAVPNGPVT
jgi:hypothetical protein